MRLVWSLKRLIRRYGYHPAKAIYRESLRRRYVRLGRWLARRQEPTMTVWPQIAPPAVDLPAGEPPQTLQWPHGEWSRYYLDTHPELRKPRFTAPIRRIELLPDDSWLNSGVPPIEQTEKYKAMPSWARE